VPRVQHLVEDTGRPMPRPIASRMAAVGSGHRAPGDRRSGASMPHLPGRGHDDGSRSG
jgi:hypothetical protein